MVDPRPTTPTRELEQESPQERLEREEKPGKDKAEDSARQEVLEALREMGAVRNEELTSRLAYEGAAEEWKRRLWRLHNEGYIKVRWVGLADPDPVEVRLTDRGREWLSQAAARAPGAAAPLPAEPGAPV